VFQGESHELLWHTSCTSWPRSHGTSEDLIPAREAAHGSGPGKRLARAFHLINVVVVAVAFAWLCSAASYVFSRFPLSRVPPGRLHPSWMPKTCLDFRYAATGWVSRWWIGGWCRGLIRTLKSTYRKSGRAGSK